MEPVSLPCVVVDGNELDDVHEERVEDPEESEVGPVGVVVVEEVDDESLQVCGHVKEGEADIENKKLQNLFKISQHPSLQTTRAEAGALVSRNFFAQIF